MATLRLAIDARKLLYTAKKVERGIKGIQRASTTTFNSVKRAASIVLGPLKAVVAVTATLKAVTIAAGLASVMAAGDYEMFNQQLRTVIATKKEADRAFKESLEFSVATPFTPDDIIRTRIELEAVGVRGKAAVADVALAAAAMNRSIADVAAAVKSLETEPLRRLGIKLRKTGDEFVFEFRDRMGEAVRIVAGGIDEARQSLLDIFGSKFGSGLKRMSLTFHGLRSTLTGVIKDVRATFGEGFLDETKLIINDLIEGGKSLKIHAKGAGQEFGDEMMRARANVLAGFDVALMIAGQIKDALKTDDGLGRVILEALNLGASLLGNAVISAFQVSLPLWKTIGTIVGQGVLNAIYQSSIPGAGMAREGAIRRNLAGKDVLDLITLAEKLGVEQTIEKTKDAGYEFSPGTMTAVPKTRKVEVAMGSKELSAALANKIGGMPIEDQLGYAEFDPGAAIAKSIRDAKNSLHKEFGELGTESKAQLQKFADGIADITGQAPIDISGEFTKSLKSRLTDGEKLLEQWRSKLDGENESGANAATGLSGGNQSSGGLGAFSQTQEMVRVLDLERSVMGKTNDERERAIELTRFQTVAEEEYGKQTEKTIRLVGEFEEKLVGLQKARKLQELADGIGDSFGRAFEDMVLGAEKVRDVMKALAEDIARMVLRQAVTRPLAEAISGFSYSLMDSSSSEQTAIENPQIFESRYGNAILNGSIVAFAGGGIVTSPTYFPMRNGTGLMGEAGPEGILPLKRTRNGRLGVESSGGGGDVKLEVNIINESSSPVKGEMGEQRFDGEKFVTNIVIKDINSFGPMRQAIGGIVR